MRSLAAKSIVAAALFQAAGLVLAGWHFRHAMNTDAVAYLRLASYYAQGRMDLAVSGYWGPLLSWLMAPLLKLGCPPLAAGRILMGLSAMLFFWGCVAVYRSFHLPEKGVVAGAWLAALASVYWSVQFITPDLLMSGLVCLAISHMRLFDPGPAAKGNSSAKSQARPGLSFWLAGVWWGLAFLAKAVAFPLAILVTFAFGCLKWWRTQKTDEPKGQPGGLNPPICCACTAGFRNALGTVLVFGLVSAPWMLVLSLKYHTPTWSTSARINHAIAGPADADRYHPYSRTFHHPEPGRITSWEEPSRMAYQNWSPIQSQAYARHQLRLVVGNLAVCLVLLSSLNLFAVPLLGLWCLNWPIRASLPQAIARWHWPLIPVVCLTALYLPVWVKLPDQRYFFAALPLLFTAGGGFVFAVIHRHAGRAELIERWGWRAMLLAGFLPVLMLPMGLRASPKTAGERAHQLAQQLRAANLSGPVAGSGLLGGGRAGLYVAFLLDQPWYGDKRRPTAADFKASQARLIVLDRSHPLALELAQNPDFRDLDVQLFAGPESAALCPLKVFEVTGHRPN